MLSFFNKIFRSTDDQQQQHNESTTNKMNLNNLSSMARNVTQNHGTEPPFSSPLNSNKQRGLYACVVCNTPIFSSEHKFDSGTGWPSFYQPYIAANLGTKTDYALMYPRTEVHCAKVKNDCFCFLKTSFNR